MITEQSVKENWVKIQGKGITIKNETNESVACIFLNGEIFLNPDYLTRIKNTIQSYETAKGMKK